MLNPLKYFRNRTVGVALGSGGAKGLAHIAVLDYLKTEGVPVHRLAGSSIGAVIGALYSIGAMERYRDELLKMDWKELLSLVDPVFPRMGLVEGKKLRGFLSKFIPEKANLEDLPVPLSVVATDYFSGLPVVFTRGNVLDALRASIAIPGVFTPVKYGDSFLIDGGVSNPLPVDVLARMKSGLTIAVNLHPTLPRRFLKKTVREALDSAAMADASAIEDGGAMSSGATAGKDGRWRISNLIGSHRKSKEEKDPAPNLFQIISQAIDIMEYMNTLMILRAFKPAVLIQPDLIDMPTLDFTHASRAIEEGYAACRRVQGQLQRKIKPWI